MIPIPSDNVLFIFNFQRIIFLVELAELKCLVFARKPIYPDTFNDIHYLRKCAILISGHSWQYSFSSDSPDLIR